jgi:hypothetical protein
MRTIQARNNPGSRVEVGDAILEAAKKTNTKAIAPRIAAFKKIHAAYLKANEQVRKADGALKAQQEKVAEADVDQDAAVQSLASALAGEGLPRTNPFKPLGFASPSAISQMAYAKQAAAVGELAAAAENRKGAGAASKKAAATARAAAKRVLTAIKPVERLEKDRSNAMAGRDALEQPWETALAALKRGAKAAEDDGAKGIYNALFVRASAKKNAKPSAKRTPKNAPAAPADQGGTG